MIAADRRVAIADLMADYAHRLDDDDVEAWPSYFTEDARYRICTREAHLQGLPLGIFQTEGRGMMRDRVRALREANIYEPHHYCHVLGVPRLTETDGAIAARTNVAVYRTMQNGETDLFASGKYLDRIVFEDDTPKLAERVVVLDSRRIDILLVLPL